MQGHVASDVKIRRERHSRVVLESDAGHGNATELLRGISNTPKHRELLLLRALAHLDCMGKPSATCLFDHHDAHRLFCLATHSFMVHKLLQPM